MLGTSTKSGYTYGLYGTPTTLELAARVCELEGGYRTIITPAARMRLPSSILHCCAPAITCCFPRAYTAPTVSWGMMCCAASASSVGYYNPTIGGRIAGLIRPNTRVIWCESPGSISMEVQDVPAIVQAAHAAGALVAMDNTWSAGVYFDALAHGVDVTMQALTKYIGGHSDLLLGSVTARDKSIYQSLGATQQLLGCAASPDDCSLALRGMKTLAVRLEKVEASALTIARWLAAVPRLSACCIPHWSPVLDTSSGSETLRDRPASSQSYCAKALTRSRCSSFVNSLELFKIGYSWGGVTSLVVAYDFGSLQGSSLVSASHRTP